VRGAGTRPLLVLSGFLGSGKTTLLRRALEAPDGRGTAVIVNELGDVGLDDQQVAHVAERTVMLENGCLCCIRREDLTETLRELVDAEERSGSSRSRRVVLETSGLAAPGPILTTIEHDPFLRNRFAVDHVVVTCDAEHALGHDRLPEWHAQIAAADTIALTKLDLVTAKRAREMRELVGRRNPGADAVDAANVDLLRLADAGARPDASAISDIDGHEHEHDHEHTTGVSTASATLDRPVDPAFVAVWLSALLHAHGQEILRIKAILDTDEASGLLVLDAVQQSVYPPRHLPSRSGPRRSTIVVIARELDARQIVAAFTAAV
jgi:G3E family GTPase